MSEPSRIQGKTETIAFRSIYGSPYQQTAVVRRNRTALETNAQFDRIYKNTSPADYSRLERLGSAYNRTMQALDATGRSSSTFNGGAVLVSRRNNRR